MGALHLHRSANLLHVSMCLTRELLDGQHQHHDSDKCSKYLLPATSPHFVYRNLFACGNVAIARRPPHAWGQDSQADDGRRSSPCVG